MSEEEIRKMAEKQKEPSAMSIDESMMHIQQVLHIDPTPEQAKELMHRYIRKRYTGSKESWDVNKIAGIRKGILLHLKTTQAKYVSREYVEDALGLTQSQANNALSILAGPGLKLVEETEANVIILNAEYRDWTSGKPGYRITEKGLAFIAKNENSPNDDWPVERDPITQEMIIS
ncbi:MAG: hypothetical protein ACYCPW_03765 [Nitrososphaerales archaeon]